jgi:hypothetical protein
MTKFLKIFYGAAIQGASDRKERAVINAGLIAAIRSLGFDVVSEHTTGENFIDTAEKLNVSIGPLPPEGKERTVFIRNKMIHFIESDIAAAIFEVSTPSLGTGVEIAHAYLRPRMGLSQIPVIALYEKGYWPNRLSAMITGISKTDVPHFCLIEYTQADDAVRQLGPLLRKLSASAPERAAGRIIARPCACCGHHEIGLETENGEYLPLKPGTRIRLG